MLPHVLTEVLERMNLKGWKNTMKKTITFFFFFFLDGNIRAFFRQLPEWKRGEWD